MSVLVEGVIVGVQVWKDPDKDMKGGFFTYDVRDTDGEKTPVKSSAIHVQGEEVRLVVEPRVSKGQNGVLRDAVELMEARSAKVSETPDWFRKGTSDKVVDLAALNVQTPRNGQTPNHAVTAGR